MARVGIVNYGMGNIWSLRSALVAVGADVDLVGDPHEAQKYSHVVLPGVGSFRRASELMVTSGLSEALIALAKGGKTSILGICLGMQLLCESSTEDGWSRGLGLVPVAFEQFVRSEVEGRPIPHIGFSPTLFPQGREGIFRGLAERTDFYFVHSYRSLPVPTLDHTATCDYGVTYLAGFDLGNLCGTQFHPEKSQSQGLCLLRNFLERKL